MKKYLIGTYVIITLLFQACKQQAMTGSWQNNKIDSTVRVTLSVQNKKLLKNLVAKDVAAVNEMVSPSLTTEMGSKLDTLVSKADLTDAADYNLLDEFYVKNAGGNTSTTVSSTHGNSNDYTVSYIPVNADSYVSVFVSKKFTLNSMVLAVYSKYDNEWKLDKLHVGEYSILNKTAPDWYTDALKLYQKGNVVSALNKIFMSFDVAHPGGALLHFKDSTKMKTFVTTLLSTANNRYHFPIVISQVKTKPQIFAVDPKFIGGGASQGVFPVIKYQSAISIKDTVALKVENLAMQKLIDSVFKGIDVDEGVIIYRAYNQLPDGKNNASFHGFVQKIR